MLTSRFVSDKLFALLLELSSLSDANGPLLTLSSLASSCLVSLAIATGETAKTLAAANCLLLSPNSHLTLPVRVRNASSMGAAYRTRISRTSDIRSRNAETTRWESHLSTIHLQTPLILVALQRAIHSLLCGSQKLPRWLDQGVPPNPVLRFRVRFPQEFNSRKEGCCLASDGSFLYLFKGGILYKITTGFGDSVEVTSFPDGIQTDHNGEQNSMRSIPGRD